MMCIYIYIYIYIYIFNYSCYTDNQKTFNVLFKVKLLCFVGGEVKRGKQDALKKLACCDHKHASDFN